MLFQCVGDRGPAGRRPLRVENLPAHACAEAGALHAGAAETAGGADEDHGQRGHLLYAPHALHLHLQVSGTHNQPEHSENNKSDKNAEKKCCKNVKEVS